MPFSSSSSIETDLLHLETYLQGRGLSDIIQKMMVSLLKSMPEEPQGWM
jgi:hypothetical protein